MFIVLRTAQTTLSLTMGQPVIRYGEGTQTRHADMTREIRRPPPLDLRNVPDDCVMEWYIEVFARLRQLIGFVEDSFPMHRRRNGNANRRDLGSR